MAGHLPEERTWRLYGTNLTLKGCIMKTMILTMAAALTFGAAQAEAGHNHYPRNPSPQYGHARHHHHGYGGAYGRYGYVQPYNYGYVTPVPVSPAPVYVYPGYGKPYPRSGVSLYGKNFGFRFSN
jgi:hypothetical protein